MWRWCGRGLLALGGAKLAVCLGLAVPLRADPIMAPFPAACTSGGGGQTKCPVTTTEYGGDPCGNSANTQCDADAACLCRNTDSRVNNNSTCECRTQ